MPRYLGLDSSTQSLSAIVIDTDTGKVVLDESVNFGTALPAYASPNGFLEHADPRVKHSNPADVGRRARSLCSKAPRRAASIGERVAGVSGAGQQHGSVYLSTPIAKARPWSTERRSAIR